MKRNNIPRNVLNTINKKTGKQISSNDIQRLAGGVKPSTMQSEAQLRKLIQSVSKMSNMPVSESTIRDIIGAVKKSGTNPKSIEQLMGLLNKK